MKKLADEKKLFYIIGEINFDINKTNQNNPQVDRYMQVITNNGAFSHITKPTRVTGKTATVLTILSPMIQRTQFYLVLYLLL